MRSRKHSIVELIAASLARLPVCDRIEVRLKSAVDDESVWLDQELMEAAFIDLAQNAVEAMEPGGILTIAVEGDQRQVMITFSDTGKGIAGENIPLLFTPFFTTKPTGEGTGLGLPSVYAAVKAHGGKISIESNADERKGPTGTMVRITLPRRLILQDTDAKIILHDE